MTHLFRSPRDDRGVVSIELVVVVVPLMLALVVCITTLSGLFQTKSRVVGAARDGARALAIKPGASPDPDTNPTDGITVVLDGDACPALTNPAYQTSTPPKVAARATKTYTASVPLLPVWTTTVTVTESASMPCG